MSLPPAPEKYERGQLQQILNAIEGELVRTEKTDQDMNLAPARRLVLSSPDGQQWSLSVDSSGTVTATAI